MPTVLVTDFTFGSLDIEEAILRPLGCDLLPRQHKTPDALAADAAAADYVITQFAPVNAAVVAAMAKARLIVRYGIGVDNVDLEAAKARGIPVCNVPDYCIDEVADHTLAMLLACTRQVVPHAVAVREARWGLASPVTAMRPLRGLTVGVVGLGRIGREVVRRLLAFGCAVRAFDPAVTASQVEALGAQHAASFDELLPASDVLTLHCPSNARTRRMIDAAALAKMPAGATLVNVARGDLVDTYALIDALQTGHLAAAALDVCDPEPIPAGHPLLGMPNVVLSPHNASVSPAAVRKLREGVAHHVARAVRGEPLTDVVNGVVTPR